MCIVDWLLYVIKIVWDEKIMNILKVILKYVLLLGMIVLVCIVVFMGVYLLIKGWIDEVMMN